MGRSLCCSKEGLNRGSWTAIEDKILTDYIKLHGEGKWRNLPKNAGLKRCGKSCRLRWLNYLRPDIKRGNISPEEEELIIRLHKLLGNRWSLIAGRLPGRTDNEIKNYWNTILGKKAKDGHQISFPHIFNHRSSNHDDHHHPQQQQQPQPNLTDGEKIAPNTASPSSSKKKQSSQAIRTKAFKCTKVFIHPSQPSNPDHHHHHHHHYNHGNALTGPLMDDNNDTTGPTHQKSMEEEHNNNLMFRCSETVGNVMDFNMEELWFSEFLSSYDHDQLIPCDNNINNDLLASSDCHPRSMIIDEILQEDRTIIAGCLEPNVDGNNSHSFNLEGDWFG